MSYNLIAIFIILGSIGVLLFVFLRKFPQLSMIDVNTIQKEKDLLVKEKIFQQRIERFFQGLFSHFAPVLKELSIGLQKRFKMLYKKVIALERRYAQKSASGTATNVSALSETVHALQEDANAFVLEGKLKQAEEKYIEILSMDHKNTEAYFGLVEVYIASKDYEKARETALYLLKLSPHEQAKGDMHIKIAEIYLAEQDISLALAHAKKAVSLAGNNPRFLNFLLELSLMTKNKELALATYEKFHLVNPDNQKLAEYKNQIERLIIQESMEKKAF